MPPELKQVTQILEAEATYQLGMDDYRILFDTKGDVVVIRRIGNRKDVYDLSLGKNHRPLRSTKAVTDRHAARGTGELERLSGFDRSPGSRRRQSATHPR
jgi:hypothetical protein